MNEVCLWTPEQNKTSTVWVGRTACDRRPSPWARSVLTVHSCFWRPLRLGISKALWPPSQPLPRRHQPLGQRTAPSKASGGEAQPHSSTHLSQLSPHSNKPSPKPVTTRPLAALSTAVFPVWPFLRSCKPYFQRWLEHTHLEELVS